jgi:hypothetical protein
MPFQQIFGATPLRPPHTDYDILADQGGMLKQRGKVLYASNFSTGHDGWQTHFVATEPRMATSLTSETSYDGSRGLMLSTAEKIYEDTDSDGQMVSCGAFRRMASWGDAEDGIISISAFVAYRSGKAVTTKPAWNNFGVLLDMQKFDNSSRNFPFIKFQSRFEEDWTTSLPPVLVLSTGFQLGPNYPSPPFDYTNPPGYIGGGQRTIVGSEWCGIGENEEKFNINYMRMSFDRTAYDGLGAYYECQMNQFHADLTHLTPQQGAHAFDRPQGTAVATEPLSNITRDYRGGLNGGISLSRSTSPTGVFPAVATFSGITITTGDVPA